MLSDDEIGCFTCSRWRTGSLRCQKFCIAFSEWKGVKKLNQELINIGCTPYKSAAEMRKSIKKGF